MFPSITHVIYDVDGLLLDTETINAQVNQQIIQRYGKSFTVDIKANIAGRSTFDSARIIVDRLALPLTPQAYLEQRKALIYHLYAQAEPLPGAVRLVKHLHQHQIPQAVATSSPRLHFDLKTTHHPWFTLFDCTVLGDDPELKKTKPSPDIFLIAAERLGASPEQCLVFEDSPAGLQAALAARMSVVVVPDSALAPQLFQQADQILTSLGDFEPQLWQLPGF
ncbi:MAG: HAD-IA family hydrolase [Cyanophyceae cyanobacterium]